jgi:hypothetical protein
MAQRTDRHRWGPSTAHLVSNWPSIKAQRLFRCHAFDAVGWLRNRRKAVMSGLRHGSLVLCGSFLRHFIPCYGRASSAVEARRPRREDAMRMTERQRTLLRQLDQIVYRRKTSGRQGYFIGREDCTATINAMIVKGLVKPSEDRRRLNLTGATP